VWRAATLARLCASSRMWHATCVILASLHICAALHPLRQPMRHPQRRPLIGMQVNYLEPDSFRAPPEKVVAAVEMVYAKQPKGTRLTAADLSSTAGISIDEARLGMKELASALAGADDLSVSASDRGDLLYTFPADVRKELASRSNAAKARDTWNSAKPVLQGIGRFSFGLALFASIAIIFTAISVLQSSSDEREDRGGFGGNERGGMMGGGGGMFGGGFGFGYGFSPLDLLFPPWPYVSAPVS
jgi:hypothetical protein